MSDLINRQAVIETIHKYFMDEIGKLPTETIEEGYECVSAQESDRILGENKAICERIKGLQTAIAEIRISEDVLVIKMDHGHLMDFSYILVEEEGTNFCRLLYEDGGEDDWYDWRDEETEDD